MYTSASKFIGIDELFYNVGCKYIDPDFKLDENKENDKSGKSNNKVNNDKDKGNNVNETNKIKKEEKKKGCC